MLLPSIELSSRRGICGMLPYNTQPGMNKNSETSVSTAPVLQKKKRYEWIDNARIVAAFLIMMHHLPCTDVAADGFSITLYVQELSRICVYNGRVPFFLILAGYFLSRNVTWKKAWSRFVWLFIPFVIWNAIYAYGYLHHTLSLQNCWIDLVGIRNILHPSIGPFYGMEFPPHPVIGPSWFLRDIMVLSLLTPLIIRFSKCIPAVLIIMTAMSTFKNPPMASQLLSPGTIYFYLLGIFLVRFSLDDVYRVLNRAFLPLFIAGVSVAALIVTYKFLSGSYAIPEETPYWMTFATTFGMGFGALLIAYSGIIIEKLTPAFSKRLAPLAPACFLVFMLHLPLFEMLRSVCPWLFEGWHSLLIPLPVFSFIVAFFLAMKHYTPFLMPYLGHMKMPKASSQSQKC